MHPSERFYHVTVLSNFARAFDKYRRQYRKSAIPQSSYPEESYLLPLKDLSIGIAKAARLMEKLRIPADRLVAMEATLENDMVRPNQRNGVGRIWPSPDLPVSRIFSIDDGGALGTPMSVEEAMGKSLRLHASSFSPYARIKPRSVSFLPVARGCQASCPFCFSEASVSADQPRGRPHEQSILEWVTLAKRRGAERAVVTGGGEPTLMPHEGLLNLIKICSSKLSKVVLITNGVQLASASRSQRLRHLGELHDAGLSVLAVSRHHSDEAVNSRLMRYATQTPVLLEAFSKQESLPALKPRLVCVLQRGGVESVSDIDEYVAWASSFGVQEICFKELYVSSSEESVYHSRASNTWSANNQVPLSIVHDWANEKGLICVAKLPWGAPIFEGVAADRPIRIAAYTEPSLFWERSHGIARSWNVMSDGTCLASLEDRCSVIEPNEVGELQ